MPRVPACLPNPAFQWISCGVGVKLELWIILSSLTDAEWCEHSIVWERTMALVRHA